MSNEISILHIDDEPDFADLAKTFLEREDDRFAVETATSADEGLQRISDRPPDCIVSDYNMPGMDGLEFLQAVRADHPDLPFILFTGKGSEEVASDAIAADVTDYLQKSRGSGQYELLANRIRNAVNARREAKRAEKQERFTTQALDALEDVFYVLNTDGSLRRWNHRLPEVTGYPESELAEIQVTELFPEDERELIAEAIETTLTDGEVTVEADFLTAGGERHPYELTGARLTDRDGNTTGLVGIGRDLTDRRQQERRFQALVEGSRENISVIDADGVFQYQSPAVERVLGYEPEETIGDTVWEYVHPDDRERLESTLEEWVATPGPAGPVEYRARHADGSWRWMQANGNNQLHNPAVEGYIVNSRDITERKERQRKLEQIETVFEHAHDALFLVDVGEEFTAERVNPAWEELTGLTAEQASGQTAQDIFDQQAGELVEDKYHKCIQRREPLRYNETIRLNGEQRHFVAQLAPVIVDGNVEYIAGSTRDVTDRKERERKLKRERERYATLFETLPSPVLHARAEDGEPIVETVNPAFEDTFDYDAEAIRNEPIQEYILPDDRDDATRQLNRRVLREGEVRTEIQRETTDGVRTFQLNVRVHNTESEDYEGYAVYTDITELKERERQLKQKTEELEQLATKFETQYRTLFEEAPVMTILTRAEDGEPIIEDCNSLFVETLGYNADAILNRELAEFYTSESAETLLEEDGYGRSLEGKFNREKRELVTAGGDVVETLLRAVPRRTADGEVIGTIAMYIDITERESVKRANERLEEFTSVVSHDLRNPLNVATGRLDLVAEEYDSDHLDDIEQALGRMETLIDDLLTLAREGKEVTDTQPVDLATMIDGCWETVETKQAVLTVHIDRRIRADRSRLKQVFENLFRNAVKHGGADVTVTVGELDNGFYIEDNGPGIPSDERADIFETGYSRSADGTGFGLSIVEQVVTAHDWQIRVTDGADGGARFEVTDVEFVAP